MSGKEGDSRKNWKASTGEKKNMRIQDRNQGKNGRIKWKTTK